MIEGQTALERLVRGNRRFYEDNTTGPRRDSKRRAETENGQSPFAVVLTCSDSRVPPEIIFDQGIGDIFVLRVAGNVVDDLVIGSIEYAVAHLSVRLILVLGHNNCGAVNAAIEPGPAEAHTGSFIEAIRPALGEAEAADPYAAVLSNIRHVVAILKGTGPVIDMSVRDEGVIIKGAVYDLLSGRVDILE